MYILPLHLSLLRCWQLLHIPAFLKLDQGL